MDSDGDKSLTALGFLSVVEDTAAGLFGGFLVLDHHGRPLEFHCTAPVKINRAQEILYGATLPAFLYGEHIGATLIATAKSKPQIVITDLPAVLAARPFVEVPFALFVDDSNTTQQGLVALGDLPLGIDPLDTSQAPRLLRLLQEIGLDDFAEPFGRIRAAIDHARSAQSARAA